MSSAMASPSLGSPSSSAVTIPRPGKSILKKAPPPQQPFFSLSRLSRLLPTPLQSPSSPSSPITNQSNNVPPSEGHLKRAHFFLPGMTTVYPISAANPPVGPTTREDKKTIEIREHERRRRIIRGNSISSGSGEIEEWWSMDKVESFYRECCEGREEKPHPGISAAMKRASGTNPRSLDLSGVQLTFGSASTLSDVFSVEWGLRKLVLRECDLDEHNLKPILHALLIPGTLSFLSVASNRRLKSGAFRLIGVFMAKAQGFQFLDVSQNILDKKSIEYIVATLGAANEKGLVSLRLDDCSLRPAALEALAHVVRTSSLRNISLRHNRIPAPGAVAVALLMKDYPDTVNTFPSPPSSTNSSTSTFSLSPPPTPTLRSGPLPGTPPLPAPRAGPIAPPPRHPTQNMQTTYTPYIPRAQRAGGRGGPGAGAAGSNPAQAHAVPPAHATLIPPPFHLSGTHGQLNVPIITSSTQGGVTTRHPALPLIPAPHHGHGPSAALLDKVRALDALPRLGELRTLDLRGNDIRGGVTYIAQVLKRNRTLKVLNLSENKIDVQGLVAIAEALKYNTNLEMLDLSRNPCCGPSLEGIQSLRTAFTLNTSLKRLFLNSTSMTSAGAIALAEFLPESASLLHLDLTDNNLELAGVMALSGGLKSNHTMRCLDLNIPPDNEEFARMCRDILNTCVRNTEEAASATTSSGKAVWGLIDESELAKTIRKEEKKSESDVVEQAKACLTELQSQISRSASVSPISSPTLSDFLDANLKERTEQLLPSLASLIQKTADPDKMEDLLSLNDALTQMLANPTEAVSVKLNGSISSLGSSPRMMNGISAASEYAESVSTLASNNSSVGGRSSPINSSEQEQIVAIAGSVGINGNDSDNAGSYFSSGMSPGSAQDYGALNDVPEEEEEEEEPSTPRIDKGKGRAEPEPEEHEKILSPTIGFMISPDVPSDEEDAEELRHMGMFAEDPEQMNMISPTDRSRSWVAEEGEVFRKGTVLLGEEEMEGEYAGEELRIELLQAEVERPPPRSLDTVGADEVDFASLTSPRLPSSPSIFQDADQPQSPLASPRLDSAPVAASLPRPYLPRSRSSSSSINRQGIPSPLPLLESIPASPLMSPRLGSNGTPPMSPVIPASPRAPYISRRRSSAAQVPSTPPLTSPLGPSTDAR